MSIRDRLRAGNPSAYDNGEAWRKAGYSGPLNDAGDPAQEKDCDPRAWALLTSGPFRQPGDPRNPR